MRRNILDAFLDWHPEILLVSGLAAVGITCLLAATRYDVEGYHVRTTQIEAYVCEHVIPGAEDHKVAICNTKEECTKICEEKSK